MLIWLVYDHEHGKKLQAWSSSPEAAANQKEIQATAQEHFDKLIEGFKPMDGLGEVQMVLSKFREAPWPQNVDSPKIKRNQLEFCKDKLYDQINKAFEEGIQNLEH